MTDWIHFWPLVLVGSFLSILGVFGLVIMYYRRKVNRSLTPRSIDIVQDEVNGEQVATITIVFEDGNEHTFTLNEEEE